MRPTTNATISDVAVAAGVSRATVSRVMNGRRVDAELTARVREAAERLNYRPSPTARSLSIGRTLAVGLVVPDLANPMFQSVLRGVTEGAYTDGYSVVVGETAERTERELEVVRATRARSDALVLVSPRSSDQDLAEALADLSPVVLVNRSLPDTSIPSVSIDYAEAMYTAIEHLMALGHESVVYLAGPPESPTHQARLLGLDRAQVSFGTVNFIVLPCGPTMADGYAQTEAVLGTRATAVVAYNDLAAFGLLAHANELGVSVPEDLSVVGFDDIELARYSTPSLTTVRALRGPLGELAWRRLREQIDSPAPGGTDRGAPDDTTEILPTRLIVRASTAPAPQTLGSLPAPHAWGGIGSENLEWVTDRDDVVLAIGGRRLARRRPGDHMPAVHSPRPFLHPIRTLSGMRLTAESPADRRHHYGLSLALPDVDGSTFWGGRTFVPGQGVTLLHNHGTQRPRPGTRRTERVGDDALLDEEIAWTDAAGDEVLTEHRRLRAGLLPGGAGWTLTWSSTLGAVRDLRLASPVQAGRDDVGYGGVFWRYAMTDQHRIATADGSDIRDCYGSRSPWLAVALHREDRWSTVMLVQRGSDPWFVRTEPYLGAGPGIAWDSPIALSAGATHDVELAAVILDGLHTPRAVAERWYSLGAALLTA